MAHEESSCSFQSLLSFAYSSFDTKAKLRYVHIALRSGLLVQGTKRRNTKHLVRMLKENVEINNAGIICLMCNLGNQAQLLSHQDLSVPLINPPTMRNLR